MFMRMELELSVPRTLGMKALLLRNLKTPITCSVLLPEKLALQKRPTALVLRAKPPPSRFFDNVRKYNVELT